MKASADAVEAVAALYGRIVTAGVHRVSSIAVAEAAKIIENVQRDINVALVNELAQILGRLGLPTSEILTAAATKWNFLPFKPGLVGGHCIGVDPYYLTYKAQAIGHHPEMILAGRRINDGMGRYISQEVIRLMLKRRIQVDGSRVLVMGLAFKENCGDIRNTRVVDLMAELHDLGVAVDVYDPWVDTASVQKATVRGHLIRQPENGAYDAIVIAVAHHCFAELGIQAIRKFASATPLIYDVKSLFPATEATAQL